MALGHLGKYIGVPVTVIRATTRANPAVDDDAGASPGTGDDRMVSGEGHGDAADEGLMPGGTEARTVECVAVHAEGAEDTFGLCNEAASKDDEGAEKVNGEEYTTVDYVTFGDISGDGEDGKEEVGKSRDGKAVAVEEEKY
ncbi:hypothetical protein MTO96_043388 [Rhipicephalus appendiculatus]